MVSTTDAVTQAIEVRPSSPRCTKPVHPSLQAQGAHTKSTAQHCSDSTIMVQALVSEASSLRRVKHRLWLDTLAVCSGVRPAFMLDYCPRAPPRAVQTMCSRLTARLHKRIFALAWQGCLWVVSQLSLACRLESSLSSAPAHPPELWLIDFCEDDALGPPVVRRPHSQVCTTCSCQE